MGEITEKIYCCDRGENDNALAAAILAGNNRKDDWSTIAAMRGEELPYSASELSSTTKVLLTESLIAEATSKNWIIA